MPTAERLSYRHNPLVQYWSLSIEPGYRADLPPGHTIRPLAERIDPSPPADWPQCIVRNLDMIRTTAVGRALIRHLRRRTTIYAGLPGEANADVDTYDDSPVSRDQEVALARASRGGFEARIRVDFNAPARHNERGLLKTVDVSLSHELAHAISITNGGYSHSFSSNISENQALASRFTSRYRATSREEAYAVIIENMYRRESRVSIRDNYIDSGATPYAGDPTDDNTGIPLTQLESAAVGHYRRFAAGFVSELERIPEAQCSYNPFRRLDRVRVPRRSVRRSVVDGR